MPFMSHCPWTRSSNGCGIRYGCHLSTNDAMDSWCDGRHRRRGVWYIFHAWFRVGGNHRYRVCAGRTNALFHDVQEVCEMSRTFLVVVDHPSFHLASKPLEMVDDGGHQYWTSLVGTHYEPKPDAYHLPILPSCDDFARICRSPTSYRP